MKCLWCGFQTTTDKALAKEDVRYREANKEHIFPESVEGQKILELGKVCQPCNDRLSKVDYFLTDIWHEKSIITSAFKQLQRK